MHLVYSKPESFRPRALATAWFFAATLALAAFVMLMPALAHAQTAATPAAAPSLITTAMAFALDHVGVVLTVILGLPVLGTFFTATRKRRVALAAYYAFHIVEDIDAETGGKLSGLEKVQKGLAAADEYMRNNGWRPLKPGESALAQQAFKVLNAQSNAGAPSSPVQVAPAPLP